MARADTVEQLGVQRTFLHKLMGVPVGCRHEPERASYRPVISHAIEGAGDQAREQLILRHEREALQLIDKEGTSIGTGKCARPICL